MESSFFHQFFRQWRLLRVFGLLSKGHDRTVVYETVVSQLGLSDRSVAKYCKIYWSTDPLRLCSRVARQDSESEKTKMFGTTVKKRIVWNDSKKTNRLERQ